MRVYRSLQHVRPALLHARKMVLFKPGNALVMLDGWLFQVRCCGHVSMSPGTAMVHVVILKPARLICGIWCSKSSLCESH